MARNDFQSRFELKFEPDLYSGCWIWTAYTDAKGYGIFKLNGVKKAHRVSYELYKGPIPYGLVLDHLCRVRCCVNPDHLEIVTPLENTKRAVWPDRKLHKEHCNHGHPFDELNTYIDAKGTKFCRACRRFRMNRIYANKKRESK